jgi:alpha-amylase
LGLGLVTEYLASKELGLVFQGKKPMHSLLQWGPKKGFVPSKDAIVFTDNHDNQRNFLKGFEILNYKDKRRYILANIFMLAHPYGIPKIMSSFEFNDTFDGPPKDENFQILSPKIGPDGMCDSNWICEHRWKEIVQMIQFRSIVGNAPITNWADNGQNQVAFCRGKIGFVAINAELSLNMKSMMKACVPPGKYCDILSGGKSGNVCVGNEIIVDQDGKVDLFLSWQREVPAIAIHIESRIE